MRRRWAKIICTPPQASTPGGALSSRRGSTWRPNRSTNALSTSVRRRWAKIILTTAKNLNNLASSTNTQGKYEEAEPLYRRALDIREKALGKDHPSTAISLNNLAALYRRAGEVREAEPLYKRALDIREKALGKDHPPPPPASTTWRRSSDTQGKYAEAEPLYKRALDICEKALGKDHPDTANSLNNLAITLSEAGEVRGGRTALQARSRHPREAAGQRSSRHSSLASTTWPRFTWQKAILFRR